MCALMFSPRTGQDLTETGLQINTIFDTHSSHMGAVDPNSSFNALLPEQFGKYSLVEKIAVGGMAEIYRAKTFGAAGLSSPLTLKLLRLSCAIEKTATMIAYGANALMTSPEPW